MGVWEGEWGGGIRAAGGGGGAPGGLVGGGGPSGAIRGGGGGWGGVQVGPGVHVASGALGAHGRLRATPLATNCWPGGGGPSWRPRTRGVAPPCHIPSGCCSFTGPWTVTRSSLRMLRRVAAFCRPLRPVLLLVSFPRSRSPVVGVPGLCWMWHGVPFACQRRPVVGVLRLCWLLWGSLDCFCCPHTSVHRPPPPVDCPPPVEGGSSTISEGTPPPKGTTLTVRGSRAESNNRSTAAAQILKYMSSKDGDAGVTQCVRLQLRTCTAPTAAALVTTSGARDRREGGDGVRLRSWPGVGGGGRRPELKMLLQNERGMA